MRMFACSGGLALGFAASLAAAATHREAPLIALDPLAVPSPYDGRNRRHADCGEPGANPCN